MKQFVRGSPPSRCAPTRTPHTHHLPNRTPYTRAHITRSTTGMGRGGMLHLCYMAWAVALAALVVLSLVPARVRYIKMHTCGLRALSLT